MTPESSERAWPASSPRMNGFRSAAGWRFWIRRTPRTWGGQAYWSFGGLFLVDSPEQRRSGLVGLAGQRRLGPVRRRLRCGRLGASLGAGLCGVCGRGEARLVAASRRALDADGGVGRARRRPRRGPRQLRAPVPCGVGHGNRRQRSVRSAGVGGRTAGRARSAVRSRSATPRSTIPSPRTCRSKAFPMRVAIWVIDWRVWPNRTSF